MITTRRNDDITASLQNGYTLPATWYTSVEHHALEQARIFRRSWQYVGLVEQVARKGDFFTAQLGDVPIVVTRDTAGMLRAFVNVCRHRGSILVEAACGNRKTLQCPYHAWTYRLDGTLHAAPGMADEPDFDSSAFSLIAAKAETWGPFIFANLDPAARPLSHFLGDLPDLVAQTGLHLDGIRQRVHRTYEIQANWKVVTENYLECYHCPVAHPAFCDLIDVNDYHVTEYDYFSTQGGSLKASAKAGKGKHGYDASQGVQAGFYAFLWPNFTINIYPGPGNVSLNLFLPLDANRTLAIYDYCFADAVGEQDCEDFVKFIDQVQNEDTALCESVQRGLRTGFFQQGKLMLKREKGLQHFQRLVHQFATS
jgi:phenylpropionate dioxygenase-like ring-hydroxylating dioxygenase large terminal subunit